MKKTSLKWKLIMLLAWSADEMVDWVQILSTPYPIIGRMSYHKDTIQRAIQDLYRVGYLDKTIKKGQVFIKVTSENKRNLIKEIPLAKMRSQSWDKLWREVIFDIPEEKQKRKLRRIIREKLIELGFGMLQKSVWISPFNMVEELEEFFQTLGVSSYVRVLEARYIGGDSEKKLAGQVWPLEEINNRYQKFIDKWKGYDFSKRSSGFKEMEADFFNLLISDPALPDELLPNHWCGRKAAKLFYGSEKIIVKMYDFCPVGQKSYVR